MVVASKEFNALMAAQEAIRLWHKTYAGQPEPAYLQENLRRAQEAHEAARQQVLTSEKQQ